jgi:META domain
VKTCYSLPRSSSRHSLLASLSVLETIMVCVARRTAGLLVAAVVLGSAFPAVASEFPFGSELMLEASPMPGSKRIPMIEIEEDGAASIDLWCASLPATANVGDDGSISIVPEPAAPAQCTPERQSGDDNLLAALTQVTGWRRRGDLIEFSGTTPLRFRLMTN